MKRKNILALIALVAVFALAMTACGGGEAAETTQAATEAVVLPLNLTSWGLSSATWSSPNGATVNLTATPNGFTEGQSAVFTVRLEGEDVVSVPCEWNGSQYTAAAELNAEDGYCYYVILTAADGTVTEVAVNTPAQPTDETLINLADALNSYCNLLVESSTFGSDKLTIDTGTAQIQLPKITNNGEVVTCSEATLVLSYDGQDLATEKLTLPEDNDSASLEMALTGIIFDVPAMEDDQQLTLRLDVLLSNGQQLSAPGGTWLYNDAGMLPVVG